MRSYSYHEFIHVTLFLSFAGLLHVGDAFLIRYSPIRKFTLGQTHAYSSNNIHRKSQHVNRCFELYAKNYNKKRAKDDSPRGGGRRKGIRSQINPNLLQKKNDDDTNEKRPAEARQPGQSPKPNTIQKHKILLDRPGIDDPPLSVIAVEVVDKEWWDDPGNENPYGARLWPSSLGVAKYLVKMGSLKNHDVLELGCGAGLISIAAAENGARVVASDISDTVLRLTKIGWIDTQKQRGRNSEGEDERKFETGSLKTFNMDLTSKRPLPFSKTSGNRKIVVAAAMLYGKFLATLLANRAFEACSRGAWVIIGDDDTGLREGGRDEFLSVFARLEKEKGVKYEATWIKSIVKHEGLKWNEKRVQILHLNKPSDISLEDILDEK